MIDYLGKGIMALALILKIHPDIPYDHVQVQDPLTPVTISASSDLVDRYKKAGYLIDKIHSGQFPLEIRVSSANTPDFYQTNPCQDGWSYNPINGLPACIRPKSWEEKKGYEYCYISGSTPLCAWIEQGANQQPLVITPPTQGGNYSSDQSPGGYYTWDEKSSRWVPASTSASNSQGTRTPLINIPKDTVQKGFTIVWIVLGSFTVITLANFFFPKKK